jgi:hypothetical protein
MVEKDKTALTKKQEIIYKYLIEGWKVKQIAKIRKISLSAVYKTINQLKKKGKFIPKNHYLFRLKKLAEGAKVHGAKIRIHGIQITAKLCKKPMSYDVRDLNRLISDFDCKIDFRKNWILIYPHLEISGDELFEVEEKMSNYISDLLIKIENKYNIVIISKDSQDIKITRAHYVCSGVYASEIEKVLGKITIKCKEDGKVLFYVDNSKDSEFETSHSRWRFDGLANFQKQLHDIVYNNPLTNSELHNLLIKLKKKNKPKKYYNIINIRRVEKKKNTLIFSKFRNLPSCS